jgi:hypothetical protein
MEEGFWRSLEYEVYSQECAIQRHVDALYNQSKGGEDSHLKGSILLIGDTLDRNFVNWVGEQFNNDSFAEDLTPFTPYTTPSGKPAQTSLNRQAWVGDLHIANMYIFGVGEGPYPRRAEVAHHDSLHDMTLDRICIDAPKHLPVSPDIVVVNSAYWDAVQLCYSPRYAFDRKSDKSRSHHPKCFREGKVNWETFILEYMQDVYRLLYAVRTCFPSAKKVLWRTTPEVAVDDRNPWWHIVPPYITSYMNNAAKYAANKNGFEMIFMDIMAAGRASDMTWTPDGIHQSSTFNKEYFNVLLNVLVDSFRSTSPDRDDIL